MRGDDQVLEFLNEQRELLRQVLKVGVERHYAFVARGAKPGRERRGFSEIPAKSYIAKARVGRGKAPQ